MSLKTIKSIDEGLAEMERYLIRRATDAINTGSIALQRHVRQDIFVNGVRGGSPSMGQLFARSGELRKNIGLAMARLDGNFVRGGLNIGTVYGKIHFDGQSHTVRPKGHPYLAIPLPAAQGPHGQAKGWARDKHLWGETFFARSKAGNLIIFGKLKYLKGENVGKTHGGIVPLFLLKRSTTVKAHISPAMLFNYTRPIIDAKLKEGKN